MSDWAAIIILILVLLGIVIIVRAFLGTFGLKSRLNDINDRIPLVADVVAGIVREEIGSLKTEIEKLQRVVREEIEPLQTEVQALRRELESLRGTIKLHR